VGEVATNWIGNNLNSHIYCIKTASNTGAGDAYNLYVGLGKPSSTFAVSDIPAITEDGLTYTVWSNPELQSMGLGYILRWKVGNHVANVYEQ